MVAGAPALWGPGALALPPAPRPAAPQASRLARGRDAQARLARVGDPEEPGRSSGTGARGLALAMAPLALAAARGDKTRRRRRGGSLGAGLGTPVLAAPGASDRVELGTMSIPHLGLRLP